MNDYIFFCDECGKPRAFDPREAIQFYEIRWRKFVCSVCNKKEMLLIDKLPRS